MAVIFGTRVDVASTPEENASMFQDFFNNLFSDDSGGDNARMEHKKDAKSRSGQVVGGLYYERNDG